MNVRLLKYSQAPLVSKFKKSINIEMYNDIYFQPSKVSVNGSSKEEVSNQIDSKGLSNYIRMNPKYNP